MFCNKCGKELDKDAVFCSKCGNQVNGNGNNNQNQSVMYVKKTVPGNGLSIAGMVLGIIAICFALIYLVSLTTSTFKVDVILYRRDIVAYAFGVILIPTALSATGLPLSISGMLKSRNGKNIAGLILNSITLIMQVFVFLYIVVNYS